MIDPKQFYNLLIESNIDFFTGIPDSLLKDFCAYITDNSPKEKNIIPANEGNAIGLAAGYHLATNKIPLVYMQNSGLGNCVNPLTSLTDAQVYSIPMLLVIGWRGEPGKKDEPQHIKKGKITLQLLDTLGIPYAILPDNSEGAEQVLGEATQYMQTTMAPYALVVKPGTFEKYQLQNKKQTKFPLTREGALKVIVPLLDEKDVVVSTTGKTSRELYELREHLGDSHERDFLTVGSMGHASSIALGIALQKSDKNVYCFDGDGAVIMHMGSLSAVGQLQPSNFKHIVINNFAHDSVGGQPTAGDVIDIPAIAKANRYKEVFSAETEEEIRSCLEKIKSIECPVLLEVRVNKGARSDLGRPHTTPIENKRAFMEFLSG